MFIYIAGSCHAATNLTELGLCGGAVGGLSVSQWGSEPRFRECVQKTTAKQHRLEMKERVQISSVNEVMWGAKNAAVEGH